MDGTELLKGAIDIHIHIGPDPNRRRRVDGYQAAVQARDAGMRAVVFKSHDYNTTPLAHTINQLVPEVYLFGGLSLDIEVGGLNPDAVEAAGKLGSKIIWMPTFSSQNDMNKQNRPGQGISILDSQNRLLPIVIEILDLINSHNMVLATGHLSTPEIFVLLEAAGQKKIDKIVITHPLSKWVGPTASIEEQKKMMRPGVYFEHCFTSCMPHSDRLDPKEIVKAIREIGSEHCIMSTDFGQITNPPPVEGMRMYMEMMMLLGITEEEIITMTKTNPAKVLGLSDACDSS